jgi:hypothetical protein
LLRICAGKQSRCASPIILGQRQPVLAMLRQTSEHRLQGAAIMNARDAGCSHAVKLERVKGTESGGIKHFKTNA